MAKIWKILALLLLITALVWLTTMWRWQSAHVDPSGADLLTHLVLVPVGLTAFLVLAIWSVAKLRNYAVSAPATPASESSPGQGGAAATAESERSAFYRVLASSVQVRAGSTWSAAQSSVAQGECKPELDAQIKDDDGVAVFTAPLPELDTDFLSEALAEHVEALVSTDPSAWAGYEAPPEVVRALTLLNMSLAPVYDALEIQYPALSALPPSSRSPQGAPVMLPSIAIRVAIPSQWSAQSQQLATAWLTQAVDPAIGAGLKAAGQSRAMANNARAAIQLHVHPVPDAESFWRLLDQQLIQWNRDKTPGLLLAAAADSGVTEGNVASMALARELFSGTNQQGRVPGEGAAALLLASPAWPVVPLTEPALAYLYRASVMRRDKSADASGRVSPQVMREAVADALKVGGVDAAQIEHVTTDADHRTSRTAEVYETLQELMPQLDTGEQALRLGVGCGDLGIARLLVCAGLASSQVQESGKPALVLGVFAPFDRFAAVLTAPPVAPPDVSAQAQPT